MHERLALGTVSYLCSECGAWRALMGSWGAAKHRLVLAGQRTCHSYHIFQSFSWPSTHVGPRRGSVTRHDLVTKEETHLDSRPSGRVEPGSVRRLRAVGLPVPWPRRLRLLLSLVAVVGTNPLSTLPVQVALCMHHRRGGRFPRNTACNGPRPPKLIRPVRQPAEHRRST